MEFFDFFTWSLALLGIVGVVFNVQKKRACFAIWMFTNVAWGVVDFHMEIYAQSFLHTVYLALSIWGWMTWTDADARA